MQPTTPFIQYTRVLPATVLLTSASVAILTIIVVPCKSVTADYSYTRGFLLLLQYAAPPLHCIRTSSSLTHIHVDADPIHQDVGEYHLYELWMVNTEDVATA